MIITFLIDDLLPFLIILAIKIVTIHKGDSEKKPNMSLITKYINHKILMCMHKIGT